MNGSERTVTSAPLAAVCSQILTAGQRNGPVVESDHIPLRPSLRFVLARRISGRLALPDQVKRDLRAASGRGRGLQFKTVARKHEETLLLRGDEVRK
jgi:hypothetical protein